MSRRRLHWTNLSFFVVVHAAALYAIAHVAVFGVAAASVWLAVVWFSLCMISISGGYHRLFSHRAYRAAWPLRAFYVLFGAASLQNSVLRWAADHRTHHAHTDGDDDPYSIQRGFWWAHMGWMLDRNAPMGDPRVVRDLAEDPLVAWQHRRYVWIATAVGGILPPALGLLWGDPVGAFLLAGPVRLTVQWHLTFFVNSFAHTFGRRPYSLRTSARDGHLAALLTLGEGYHNFHHRFPGDYRNGVRWYDFDPTKWMVWLFARVGVTKGLRRASRESIARARARTREARRQRTAA